MSDEPIIYLDSPEAATYRTDIKGWVSRRGQYCGDGPHSEAAARYDGATRRRCECGETCEKYMSKCGKCRHAADIAAYWARPSRPYDGGMVYSEATDKYYDSPEDAIEESASDDEDFDENTPDAEVIAGLRLMLCDPVYARELDADYFGDELPSEEYDIPTELENAIDAFNEAVKGVVLSWQVGKYRLSLSSETKTEVINSEEHHQ